MTADDLEWIKANKLEFRNSLITLDMSGATLSGTGTIPEGFMSGAISASARPVLKYFSAPVGTTSIGRQAFFYCSRLEDLSLPEVVSTGVESLFGCESLTSLSLPAAATIGASTFSFCSKLETIELPVVEAIDNFAFQYARLLQTADFPTATSMGSGVFNCCYALKSVNLPNVTTFPGSQHFGFCYQLELISLNTNTIAANMFTDCRALTTVNMPNATSIGNGAFTACTSLESISIPSITTVGTHVFNTCTSLKYVDFPNATSIGEFAFTHCTALEAVAFPKVESLGNNTFYCADDYASMYGYSSLKEAHFPSLINIGNGVFWNCRALEMVIMPKVESIGERAFMECNSLCDYYLGTTYPATIKETAFDGSMSTPTYHIPHNSEFASFAFPGHTPTISYDGGGVDDPVLFNVTANNAVVKNGDSLGVSVAFSAVQESNAAAVTFAYNADLFNYTGFTAADGVAVIDETAADGMVKITVARLGDYAMAALGTAGFTYKGSGEESEISISVDYALRDGSEKSMAHAAASISITAQGVVVPTGPWEDWKPGTTVPGKNTVDLIDLSNVIDWFGLDSGAADWDALINFFDFNGNGAIDIYDIVFVAQQIAA